MAMEQNSYDDTNSFGRRIDVLINVKDTSTALNSNEWKAIKANHFKLTQQSKNIRSNCAILNKLYILPSGQFSSIMALDMTFDAILLPTDMIELKAFKNSLNTLIKWRKFMREQIKTIKNSTTVKDLSSAAHDIHSEEQGYSEEDNTVLPSIFFTLKNKRAPKRAYEEIDDSEDRFDGLHDSNGKGIYYLHSVLIAVSGHPN
ncbi:hypothetical protein BDC45DRAFT_539616 [Circinella umbellata]|nr:hypothetical protein BDC45DRAFT_539616 [Circinella umbellata]